MAGAEDFAPSEFDDTAGIPKPQLGVEAHAVDTMVTPKAGNDLAQFAKALGSVSPVLAQFGEQLQQRQEQEGKMAAESLTPDMVAKDQNDFRTAVSRGDIPSYANPYARLYAKQTFGRLAAGNWMADLMSDPKVAQVYNNSTDPQAFMNVAQQHLAQFKQDHFDSTHNSDQAFQASFGEMSSGYLHQKNMEYAMKVNERFVGITARQTTNEIATHVREEISNHADPEEIREQLSSMVDGAITKGGLPPMLAPAAVGKALDAIARDSGDSSVYEIARGLKYTTADGKQLDMYDDEDMAALREKGRNEILHTEHTALQVANQTKTARDTALRSKAATDLITAQEASPNTPVDLKPYEDQYTAAGLGSRVGELGKLQKAIMNQQPSDPQTVKNLMAGIYESNDPTGAGHVSKVSLITALNSGEINTTDFKSLAAEIDRRDRANGHGRRNPTMPVDDYAKAQTEAIENLKTVFLGHNLVGSVEGTMYDSWMNAHSLFIDAMHHLPENITRSDFTKWSDAEIVRLHKMSTSPNAYKRLDAKTEAASFTEEDDTQ